MRIKDSIQRLGWRLQESVKKNKGFIPNENDLQAFNTVVDFYDKMKEGNYRNNELMFKMYIWHRVEMMKHYDSDVFDDIPQKILVETLMKPTEVFLKRLTGYLNDREYKVMMTNAPVNEKPFFLQSKEQREKSDDKIRNLLKSNPDLFMNLTGDAWEIEDVNDNILAEFNQLLLLS